MRPSLPGRREHTKESEIIVLRPAVILRVAAKGTLTDCGAADRVAADRGWLGFGHALRWDQLRRLPQVRGVSRLMRLGS